MTALTHPQVLHIPQPEDEHLQAEVCLKAGPDAHAGQQPLHLDQGRRRGVESIACCSQGHQDNRLFLVPLSAKARPATQINF